jgi:hypothetical protein
MILGYVLGSKHQSSILIVFPSTRLLHVYTQSIPLLFYCKVMQREYNMN